MISICGVILFKGKKSSCALSLGQHQNFDLRKERETLDNCGRCGGGASKPKGSHMCGLLCETTIAKDFRTSKA
jgi:hypothetical protein